MTSGIALGFAWRRVADATVIYADLGVSRGMWHGIRDTESETDHAVEFRYLGGEWSNGDA